MSTAASYGLLLARALMAGVFVFSAWGKLRGDDREMKAFVGLHLPYPTLLAKLVGACEITGALMLVLGVFAQLAAVLLGAFLLSVTLIFLRFWSLPEGDDRFNVENAFFGNFGLLGGLIYVATAGPGSFALLSPIL